MPRTSIPVVYRPEQSVPNLSYSPSADKPRQVVADWLAHGMPITVVSPEPLSLDDLKRVHAAAYLDGLFGGRIDNGFRNRDAAVNQAMLYTTGAMALAAKIALREGVACAPVSGFHHASYDFGGGFCTVNGLMSAIEQASRDVDGGTLAAGILDLDYHFGNGTADVLKRAPMRGVAVRHFTAGDTYHGPSQARALLRALPALVKSMTLSCDLILYQAGADQHKDDPLGGIFTTEQMRQRDRIVFETFVEWQRPGTGLAWNLAGGYQRDASDTIRPVLELHRLTMQECVAAFMGIRA